MSDIGNIIETLATAKQALEENPILKSQLEDMRAHISKLEEAHMQLQAKHADLHNNHDEACIKVTELEASLEAARFQELAANKKLNKLAEIVGEALHEALPAVEPVVEPVIEVVDTTPDVGVVDTVQPYVNMGAGSLQIDAILSDGTVIDHKTYESTVNPTLEATSIDGSNIVEDTARVNPTLGISPGSEPILSSGGSEVAPFVTNLVITNLGPSLKPEADLVMIEGTNPNQFQVVESAPQTPDEIAPRPSIQSLPNYGKPYSFKPNSMSWREWITTGGQRPWWCTDEYLNTIELSPIVANG